LILILNLVDGEEIMVVIDEKGDKKIWWELIGTWEN
jgi:hypothetical protein